MALIDLTPIQQVSVAKAVAEGAFDTAKKLIGAGSYVTDTSIRVVGTINVGKPYAQSIAMSFPWQKFALRLATRLPKHVLNAVLRDMQNDSEDEALKEHVYAMWADIKAGSTNMCNGKITAKLDVELIGNK